MSSLIMEQDAFIRKIGISKDVRYGFFLGAGSSVSSAMPSAETCIWEWKRSIFLSNNVGLEPQFSELTLNSVRQKIQKWLDHQGNYPRQGEDIEYSFYIEKCYYTKDDRKRFFEEKIQNSKPYLGYKLLCLLAESGLTDTIFTTNFDNLVARAASNFKITPIEIGIDSQNRLSRQRSPKDLYCISLHGDYRYDDLKNTEKEVQEQEKALCEHLVEYATNNPLIVCGYSGRDQSIMNCLLDAYTKKGSGEIYWCGYGEVILPNVENLLNAARESGKAAYFIPTVGFDDLLKRIALFCLSGSQSSKARSIISETETKNTYQKAPFQIPDDLPTKTVIKSNIFEIKCPDDVFQFEIADWPDSNAWKWIDNISNNRGFSAVPFKRKVLSLGNIEEIKHALNGKIKGEIERIPIDENEFNYEDGIINSLFRKALVKAIASDTNLGCDFRGQVWEKNPFRNWREGEFNCNIHDASLIFLRKIGGKIYLILKPSLRIENGHGVEIELPLVVINKVKNAILGYQHNREFNQSVNKWRETILQNKNDPKSPIKTLEIGGHSKSGFIFKIRRSPVFAEIKSKSQKASIKFADNLKPLIKQEGVRIDEPRLLFSNKQGTNFIHDEHPLRGLVSNRPYDFSITQTGLLPDIKLGVICPKLEENFFESYLLQGQSRQIPIESEKDYLIDYPGFSSAFGLPIDIPKTGEERWVSCPEPTQQETRQASLELARLLIQAVNEIDASQKPNVILICIPSRWKNFRGFETDDENFDLHDYVKAHCVQRGISSQFIEQETLTDKFQARIWWWLSLAIYAKSMRTPWVLDGLNADTAFVGLGYSINQKAQKGRHIILGCSHLYNAKGEGLQFRLSPIENPTIVRGNAFMSQEDARNVGENIRHLFFESSNKLPKRVVIHKQTAFRKEEKEGLFEGLSGVEEIEMLEVNFDSAMRYVASIQKQNGKLDEDNYPVQRGTVLKLDSYSSLIWVHGVTESIKRGYKYYKGKRRIPTPLIIKRHSGKSDIMQIASEILALSKMDWNSADMYSKLPATIQSSQKIAKIGSLLQRFGPISYDYRLFI